MQFKTETQLRQEFETMVEGTMDEHFTEFITYGETIKKQQEETNAQMRKEGFYQLANEAEQKMNAQHEAHQKQIAEAKEEAFQQYLAQYNKYKEQIIAIQKLTDETIKKVKEETVKAIK